MYLISLPKHAFPGDEKFYLYFYITRTLPVSRYTQVFSHSGKIRT